MQKIGILAYQNCTASMLYGVADILSLANAQLLAQERDPLFAVEIFTMDNQPVECFNGLTIHPSHKLRTTRGYDLLYIPGFVGNEESTLEQEAKSIELIRSCFRKGSKLAAACNGNFFLAEAGVLNGKKATTHWALKEKFQSKYKEVRLQPEHIIVDEGNIISAAGVTAYFNLALFIVQKFGSKELSTSCSKVFLVDSGRRIQTPYQMYQTPKNHGDREVVHIQEWLEENYTEEIDNKKLELLSNLSKKTLERRFKKATGYTPLKYLQKIRIETAKKMLESLKLSFNEITWKVGYEDVSSFHKLFKADTGLNPIAYRRKFSLIYSNEDTKP
ncbi:GlxA family transcriptional regulator [Muricauda sp. MAR_2010_75]|jgi:transcriptional regulator GlxA family with amidase domain|uniref:GlxA family transcriptional regulator n=1 Tax=Allomuricauda sp. MAR_2010_75 TaxID=1250232 RepID=UPI00068D4EFE|nr:helix-turn-helix domain-containing protein [Muricauda sp. MAR_2010_75]